MVMMFGIGFFELIILGVMGLVIVAVIVAAASSKNRRK